ncbi:uncharacterized protein LTR77_003545 [Saxophila tyrrhenica]|uniref:Uncharacterized protein n=1 Tax=Saxophila tyrrhenica TaxID=1690608 RepID=A0AAV9PDW8_9PEZI|nr:hypothetical protein LTR77_003545 [Saxophila tyrrhenica]
MVPLAEVYNDPLPRPQSLWHMLNSAADAHADSAAITSMHQAPNHLAKLIRNPKTRSNDPWLCWTHADVKRAALSVSAGMTAAGVQRGPTVATFISNGVESELMLWIAAVLQITLVPLDFGLVMKGRREQLDDYLKRLNPDVVVVGDEAGAEALDEALDEALGECGLDTILRVVCSETERDGWRSFESLGVAELTDEQEASVTKQDAGIEKHGDRPAVILFTSGTSTGRPKGCPLSATNVLNASVNLAAVRDLPNGILVQSVNFRSISYMISTIALGTGRHIIMPAATFSTSTTLDAVEKCKAEFLICIPVQVQMFAQDPTFKYRDLSSLRRVAIGGDMVTTDVLVKARSMFPHTHVDTGHGMTEGVGVLGWGPDTLHDDVPEHHGILSVGVPAQGTNVRICDQNGNIVGRGEEGELHLGGFSMVPGYLGGEQPEASYQDSHGNWLKTGDRAFMTEKGAVFMIGRIKDIIKKVGISLSPAVIESVLNSREGVQASVFGMPDPRYGEVPVAVVRDKPSEDLKRVVVDKLGSEHALQDVVTLEELGLESFPYNQTMKVMKITLREALQRKLGQT